MKLCESCGACLEDVEGTCGYDGGELRTLFHGSRVIGGRYLLEQRVSAGAMGIVLRATHLQVGSTVAVKLMRPGPDRHVALARFQREAQILGRIKHPNAVLVMDFGVDTRAGEAVPYLVMEYLRGENLLAHLERHAPLTLAQTERILAPLCDAVEEAHAVGVIHRDLKPSNVVLERLRDGAEIVKVLDFGIGKFIASGAPQRAVPAPVSLADGAPVASPAAPGLAADAGAAAVHPAQASGEGDGLVGLDELDELDELAELLAEDEPADDDAGAALAEAPTVPGRATRAVPEPTPPHDPTTSAGLMIGTVPYMAAEQMTGEKITRASDVHAVAVMIFQCLSGRLPFDGDDDEVIAAKLADERPSLLDLGVEVPKELDALLRRAFARDPAERPGSVTALATALREAAQGEGSPGGAAAADPASMARSLVAALEEVAAALRATHGARVGEDHYANARDRLLSISEPMQRLRDALASAPLAARSSAAEALNELEGAVAAVRRALARLGAQPAGGGEELADYLRALWMRLDLLAQECLDARGSTGAAATPAPAWGVGLFAAATPGAAALDGLAERLLGRDPLDAADALDELLSSSLDALVRAFGPGDDDALAERLLQALWRHADALLLHELTPAPRAFRLLPTLAGLGRAGAAPFAALARLFAQGSTGKDLAATVEALPAEQRASMLRCALLHPGDAVRAAAVAGLEPAALWSVIAHPATPLHVERSLFEQLSQRARSEYLKVFFFCVRDNLLAAASASELGEALALMRRFFSVPCFHEDIVFEPLLDLERKLRERARASSGAAPDDAYGEALAEFSARGATDTRAIESLMDVPLPIQRKLARDGHFLSFFVSHQNERVARETLPHLLRHEDITPFLRIATIHRAVITELAKRRRFFRKDAAKLALLENPKTPAGAARGYAHLVSAEQLRLLAVNRHINPDVRRLVAAMVER